MYWWGVARAAVSVGVQVVERAVQLLVGRVQQVRRAAPQRTWWTSSQQTWWATTQESRRTYGQTRRVSAQQAVTATQWPSGAVHKAGVPE